MRTKTLVIVALAFAAGGTCPSDVNNDGTVGINDFLAVLGAWGPCPSSRLVGAIGAQGAQFHARLWSDGTIEEFDPGAGIIEWTQVSGGAYAPTLGVQAVSLHGWDGLLMRAWSDGTVEKRFRPDDSMPWDTDQWQIVGP